MILIASNIPQDHNITIDNILDPDVKKKIELYVFIKVMLTPTLSDEDINKLIEIQKLIYRLTINVQQNIISDDNTITEYKELMAQVRICINNLEYLLTRYNLTKFTQKIPINQLKIFSHMLKPMERILNNYNTENYCKGLPDIKHGISVCYSYLPKLLIKLSKGEIHDVEDLFPLDVINRHHNGIYPCIDYYYKYLTVDNNIPKPSKVMMGIITNKANKEQLSLTCNHLIKALLVSDKNKYNIILSGILKNNDDSYNSAYIQKLTHWFAMNLNSDKSIKKHLCEYLNEIEQQDQYDNYCENFDNSDNKLQLIYNIFIMGHEQETSLFIDLMKMKLEIHQITNNIKKDINNHNPNYHKMILFKMVALLIDASNPEIPIYKIEENEQLKLLQIIDFMNGLMTRIIDAYQSPCLHNNFLNYLLYTITIGSLVSFCTTYTQIKQEILDKPYVSDKDNL